MALHLYSRQKCRMCNARLAAVETVERPRVERGVNILYEGVRRLACPNGCPVSLYDFSKATALGPAPARTAPVLPAEPDKPEGDAAPKKRKRTAKEGAERVDEKANEQKDAKAKAEPEAKATEKKTETGADDAADAGETAEATETTAGGAQGVAEGEAKTKAPGVDGETAKGGEATKPAPQTEPSEPSSGSGDEEGDAPKPATESASATVAAAPQPKSRVPAVLGRIYMIVGFAFAYFLFIMTIVVADVPPAVKLSYAMLLGGIAFLNALAFFMPNRSRDEQAG